jgi:hypothetical protein
MIYVGNSCPSECNVFFKELPFYFLIIILQKGSIINYPPSPIYCSPSPLTPISYKHGCHLYVPFLSSGVSLSEESALYREGWRAADILKLTGGLAGAEQSEQVQDTGSGLGRCPQGG